MIMLSMIMTLILLIMNADDIHIVLMMSFFCFDFQIMFETSSEVKT